MLSEANEMAASGVPETARSQVFACISAAAACHQFLSIILLLAEEPFCSTPQHCNVLPPALWGEYMNPW